MNFIISLASGLLSSLLLSLGFSRMAARFDHLDRAAANNIYLKGDQALAATPCLPCRWQEV